MLENAFAAIRREQQIEMFFDDPSGSFRGLDAFPVHIPVAIAKKLWREKFFRPAQAEQIRKGKCSYFYF